MAEADEILNFNGINAVGGGYLLGGITDADLGTVAMGAHGDADELALLREKLAAAEDVNFGVVEGVDPNRLAEAGWGILLPRVKPGSPEDQLHEKILDQLAPLISHRRAQAGARFAILRHDKGLPLLGRGARVDVNEFLVKNGLGPGPIDPAKLPYYLLLVADPAVVSFEHQYLLDVQGAIGRLWFNRVEEGEYEAYARAVVDHERDQPAPDAVDIGFFGVANPNDTATQLSAQHLIAGLEAALTERPEMAPRLRPTIRAEAATKQALVGLIDGGQSPRLLFTASHGMGFPKGHALQRDHQGALLCQDWPGPRDHQGDIPPSMYYSFEDVGPEADLRGRVVFSFACYGAGTPQQDDFFRRARDSQRAEIADAAFLSRLPQRLLSRGALAFIGHVERAWGYSFLWRGVGRANGTNSDALLTAFQSGIDAMLAGKPVGQAMDVFNIKYAQFATWLTQTLDDIDYGKKVDPRELAELWTCLNDARDTIIIGDPAVRLYGAEPGEMETAVIGEDADDLSPPIVAPVAVAPVAEAPLVAAPVSFAAPATVAARVVRTWIAGPAGEGDRLVAESRLHADGAVDHIIGAPAPDFETYARHLDAVERAARS